jgi:hypothetical protein
MIQGARTTDRSSGPPFGACRAGMRGAGARPIRAGQAAHGRILPMYDLVFLHAGGANMRGLQGPYFPIGWLGLASFLKEHGYQVSIVNHFLERLRNPSAGIGSLLREFPARVYGIDLHWFVHCAEALVLAEQVRQRAPGSRVILGGLTASCFAGDILREHGCVDGILRGDGEVPALRYLEETAKDLPLLHTVPNLSYRVGAEVRHNPITYVASPQDLDQLDLLDFSPVVRGTDMFYLNNADYSTKPGAEVSAERYVRPKDSARHWFVYTGRGCMFDCSFCGGSRSAFYATSRRTGLALRSPGRVAEDVLRLAHDMQIDCIYFPHSPLTAPAGFHEEILRCLRKSTTRLHCGFFFEDVPFRVDWNVLQGYMGLFNMRKSVIRVYLVDGSEGVRTRNHFHLSVDLVFQLAEFCRDLPVLVQVAVLVGLPGQTRATCRKAARTLRRLSRYGCYPLIYTGEMHPASLLHREPSAFGISQQTASFGEFRQHLQTQTNKAMFVGYQAGSDCSAEEQRIMLEAALSCPVVKIQADGPLGHEDPRREPRAPGSSSLLAGQRSLTNEYAKRIAHAHAVGAKKVLFSIPHGPARCNLPGLLRLCQRLRLSVTIRCRADAAARLRSHGQFPAGMDVAWEIMTAEPNAGIPGVRTRESHPR